MNRPLTAVVLACLAASAAAQAPEPLDPRCEKLLPAPVAAKIIGISPLTLVGRFQMEAAGGTCNYVTDGKLVLLITIDTGGGAEAAWRRRYSESAMYKAQKKPVSGLGSEAFVAFDALFVRKGNDAISFGSFFNPKTFAPFVKANGLVAAAKEVVGRMR
jgi:hypothetical protein